MTKTGHRTRRTTAVGLLLGLAVGLLVTAADAASAGGAPAFTVVKSADQTTVAAGDRIDYDVTITNTGGVTLTGITVTDPNAPGCNDLVSPLAPGADVTLSCIEFPGLDDIGTYTNVATVDTAETDPVDSNAVDVAVTTPRCGGEDVTVLVVDGDAPTPGPDVILGTDEGDVIEAAGGADVVCGGRGADEVHGGLGDDRIFGGLRPDRIYGDGGDDAIVGNDHRDQISGGAGDDRIDGGDGPDVLGGDGGADDLVGGARADVVDGGAGDDRLRGLAGNDVVGGWLGDDLLEGGEGDDFLDGGAARDRLFGGSGRDRCHGGAGQFDTAAACEVVNEVP